MSLLKSIPLRILFFLVCALLIVVLKSNGAGSRSQTRKERTPASDRAQSENTSNVVRLSAEAKPTASAGLKSPDNAVFDAAVISNTQLRNSLEWNFGGKLQRGWNLYTLLIGDLIGANLGGTPEEFASQLSLWQRKTGIEPTGVLDRDTWSQMIGVFQSRRMNGRTYPTPNDLVTIPVTDCYDPTRPEALRSAERQTFAAYKRMVGAAAADSTVGLRVGPDGQLDPDEKFLKVVSAFRSREHQELLRKQSPNSGRAGLALNSPHFTGRALDLYVGGEPVSTKDDNRAIQTQTAAYRWLVKNAARFGFRPYFYEPWHWEYVGTSTAQ
ncbi:MAG TPA: D-alanyl-D-alanine carboxypeptidase family protein [Blastocatellia bacterium]|nr:D-alanyl-D-alanine carboxypeptidase family protein [Blastocatellia bacterium]